MIVCLMYLTFEERILLDIMWEGGVSIESGGEVDISENLAFF